MNTRLTLFRRAACSGACIAAVVAISGAQFVAQGVTIGPMLRTGDTFRLEVIRVHEDSARPQRSGTSRTPVDVRVLSVNTDGIVVEWTPRESELDYPQTFGDPTIAAAAAAVRDVSFRLNLNVEGVLLGVANETQIARDLQASVDVFASDFSSRLPEAQRAALQNMVAQVLSPEAIIATSRRGAELFFLLNGFVLAPGDAFAVPVNASISPVGVAIGTFRVELVSATPAVASLSTTTTYDRAALMRLAEAIALQGGALTTPAAAGPPSMQMTDDGRYTFDRSLGLMREVVVDRRMILGDWRRRDAWEIRLIDAPTR